nr:craniofacial development protein 2-like [Helicoverpa armigera]
MSNVEEMSDRARAYPSGDAQGQHPAPVGSGQGFLHQPGRVQCKKRVREVRLRYASWNVGTMTGRARELADVLKRRRINVACLQETKWKGTKAREIGEGYKFYYCGSDGKRNGVGIVLDKNLKESVIDVNRVNDRIIVVKIMYESLIINVISVYAPQVGCDDRVKEQFWTDFDAVMMNVPTNEQVFVGGDFNGHVGRMRGNYERVHGGWGFGCQNDEGEALLQAATAFDLAVVNTWFQKNTEHLITYKSGHHVTQIDYFLVRRSSLKNIKDCKVIPGEAVVSQHRPLIMDVILTSRPKAKERRPPKIKWHLLGKAELAREFRKVVVDKMIEMGEMNEKNVNECWSGMATCIRKAARSILGESKGNGVIEKETWWWVEEVQSVLKEKKMKFKEWQRTEDNDDSEKARKKAEYDECKKKAKKIVAVSRAKAHERMYDSLDSPAGQNDFYRLVKSRGK